VPVLLLGVMLAAGWIRPRVAGVVSLSGAAGTRDKELLMLSSAAHGTNLLQFGPEGAKARAVLHRFITTHLDR
jgi:hypothetical protein